VTVRTRWETTDYLIEPPRGSEPGPWSGLAEACYLRACRFDFTAPGFALLPLQAETPSRTVRHWMTELAGRLDRLHVEWAGRRLAVRSMTRFDQQVTTKPHRDGAADESLLMLGYEPTTVRSRVFMTDFTACARGIHQDPEEFLRTHNPMYARGAELLAPYTTELTAFDPSRPQILLVNNSCRPYDPERHVMQGVLHHAEIPNPDPTARRIINSVVLTPLAIDEPDPLPPQERGRFLETDSISGY
jgi:hypothetical protein